MKKYLFAIAILFLAAGCNQSAVVSNQTPATVPQPPVVATTTSPQANPASSALVNPLSGGKSRITKKFFGTKVSPQNSPVSPERFSGYHTGVDFETTPEEQNIEVKVSAICNGKLQMKKWASGYGGVAVQSCVINSQDVTIIYGHLLITSVAAKVGDAITAGQQLGILGKGYSQETDGERKHLHLAIHKGTEVNILGYVQKSTDLSGWFDPLTYLP